MAGEAPCLLTHKLQRAAREAPPEHPDTFLADMLAALAMGLPASRRKVVIASVRSAADRTRDPDHLAAARHVLDALR